MTRRDGVHSPTTGVRSLRRGKDSKTIQSRSGKFDRGFDLPVRDPTDRGFSRRLLLGEGRRRGRRGTWMWMRRGYDGRSV